MEVFHYFKVEDGLPIFDDVQMFNKAIKGLKGEKYYMLIKPYRKKKSYAQQKFYFGTIVPMIADAMGEPPERRMKVHKYLCKELLTVKDGQLEYVESTKLDRWTTVEWNLYMERLQRWGVEFWGINLPEPNEGVR